MGLFEHYPLLLLPIIIATVEIWNAAKVVVRELFGLDETARH